MTKKNLVSYIRTKNLFVLALTLAFAMTFFYTPSKAAAVIKKAEYEGKGKVEVRFKSKVKYKDVKVTAKDSDGNSVSTKIIDKDSDDLEFKIKNYKPGKTYKFTIKGIRKKSEDNYGQVSGSVKIPKAAGGIPIEKIEYDANDKEVTFDFDTKVEWKSPKVTIKKDGSNYVKKIKEKDSEDIEVSVKKLTKGTSYSYKISGIRKKGSGDYTTISGTFTP